MGNCGLCHMTLLAAPVLQDKTLREHPQVPLHQLTLRTCHCGHSAVSPVAVPDSVPDAVMVREDSSRSPISCNYLEGL